MQYILKNAIFSLDLSKQPTLQNLTAAPTKSFTPDLLDDAFSSAPVPNSSAQSPGQGFSQDMFDKAFGTPDPNPFGAPPVVGKLIHLNVHFCSLNPCGHNSLLLQNAVAQTSGSTDAFGDAFGNPFA